MKGKRARSAEDKETRKNTILKAAWELYEQSEGKLPTVLSIAEKTGLSKGAIYLYFKSKEEIFLSQCVYKLKEWFAAILQSVDYEKDQTAREVATQYVRYVVDNPLVLKITSLIKGVLEVNIDDEFVYQTKLEIAALLTSAGKMLADLIPGVTEREGTKFILRAYSL
ncbi:TetR/AcrR family transcriptional regulator, partial [bacterium]|nr:TetR/AcrR family transcriptional regulator [bacterium]